MTISNDAAPASSATVPADELDLLHDVVELSRLRLLSAERLHGDAGPDGFVVGYRVRVADDAGNLADHVMYVATAPRGDDRPGVLRLRDDSGDERAVWVHPNDPRLPGLAHAVVPVRAAALLGEFERDGAEPARFEPDEPLDLEITAYRPGKRAVVRATRGDHRVYLKVVPPRRAAAIRDRHAAWHAAGLPVPRTVGSTEDGIVALEEVPGLPAGDALDRVDADRLLDELDDLRRRIAAVPSDVPARASLASRADWYARRVTELAPDLADRSRGLRDEIMRRTAHRDDPDHGDDPDVRGARLARPTIHGDLHLGQLFVDEADPSHVLGLIDIDTAGVGDPADDDAALWAHLVATAAHAESRGDTARAERADAFAAAARERWADGPGVPGGVERIERVAAIAATHLLGHALTGALDPRDAVDRAERLLGR